MKYQKNSSKIKSLHVLNYFVTKTSEDHPATATDIINHLSSMGIPAQRRCIYRDIETLRSLGLKINKKGYGFYYKPTEGDFVYEIAIGFKR